MKSNNLGRPSKNIFELEKHYRSKKSKKERQQKSRHQFWLQTIFWILYKVILNCDRDARFIYFYESLNNKIVNTIEWGEISVSEYINNFFQIVRVKGNVTIERIESLRSGIDDNFNFQEEVMEPFTKCLVGDGQNVDEIFLETLFDVELVIDIDRKIRGEIHYYMVKCHSLAGTNIEDYYDKEIEKLVQKIQIIEQEKKNAPTIDKTADSSNLEETKDESTCSVPWQVKSQRKIKGSKAVEYPLNTEELSSDLGIKHTEQPVDFVENYECNDPQDSDSSDLSGAPQYQQIRTLSPEKNSESSVQFVSKYEQEECIDANWDNLFRNYPNEFPPGNNQNVRETERSEENNRMEICNYSISNSQIAPPTEQILNFKQTTDLPSNEANGSFSGKQDSMELVPQEVIHIQTDANQQSIDLPMDTYSELGLESINSDSNGNTHIQQFQPEEYNHVSSEPDKMDMDEKLDSDFNKYSTQASINEGNRECLSHSFESELFDEIGYSLNLN
ncbi:unnamed protein product [Blepharisma stoltei]|uniref:Uncharacterized protein n=1 Tax=Blepharisma stoltei TaxID=1481888 RepID=A0AAU9K2R8_9CILI|nr:unnamed protein product [Blepharisma stoltei]